MKLVLESTLALALALGAFAPAQAADRSSVAVSVDGLDLTTAKGQRGLERRIKSAAHTLCDTANERFSPDVRASQRACRDEAVSSTLARIGQVRIASR